MMFAGIEVEMVVDVSDKISQLITAREVVHIHCISRETDIYVGLLKEETVKSEVDGKWIGVGDGINSFVDETVSGKRVI